jgi:hypothetical protein
MESALDRLAKLPFVHGKFDEYRMALVIAREAANAYKLGQSPLDCPPYRDDRMTGAWMAGWACAHIIHHEATPETARRRCPPGCDMGHPCG